MAPIIPVPDGSVDVAYSNQLMEHLHPDDAQAQLADIHRALGPGGCYVCVTPRPAPPAPGDVSMYFDEVARGFHLREYTVGELRAMFRRVGFRRIDFYAGGREFLSAGCRPVLVQASEQVLQALLVCGAQPAVALDAGARPASALRVIAYK